MPGEAAGSLGTLQIGPEPATAGRHSLEMASSEAKDSPLVHFISLNGSAF